MTDGERFAAGPVVDEIREHLQVDVELLEMAELGDSGGAAYIRWPDGRVGVLTRPVTTLERMQLTAEVLAFAKEWGLPVPRHELVVRLRDGEVAVVQERLPGAPVERVTVGVIDAMWAMNERFAGLLADRPEVPIPSLCLRQSGPDYPRHELLERYSDRTRRMLRRIRQLGAEPPLEMIGSDLLHLDFARGNVLFDERGQVSGVVDWNLGVARGDRRLALACLRNDLEWSVLNPQHKGRPKCDRSPG